MEEEFNLKSQFEAVDEIIDEEELVSPEFRSGQRVNSMMRTPNVNSTTKLDRGISFTVEKVDQNMSGSNYNINGEYSSRGSSRNNENDASTRGMISSNKVLPEDPSEHKTAKVF